MRLGERLGDRGLLILVLLVLALIVIAERVIVTQLTPDPPLSSWSDDENGASAVYEWLDQLGYDLAERRIAQFAVPEDVGLVLMLEPSTEVTSNELAILSDWVAREDGVLIVSGAGFPARTVYAHFGYPLSQPNIIEMAEMGPLSINQESPFLDWVDVQGEFAVNVTLETFDWAPELDQVVHTTIDGAPFIVSYSLEGGQVIFVPETSVFSNQGLSGEANRDLLLNLLAQQGAGSRIWFNEWHHGERELDFSNGQISGPLDWLRFTTAGRAVLLVLVVVFAFMLLQGRHLGRPQPLPESLTRRGPAEYVDALATLTRQTGDTEIVREHAYARFRRRLIKRYRLDPVITDEKMVERLGRIKSAEMAEQTAVILRQLQRTDQTELELIDLQKQIDEFMEENL